MLATGFFLPLKVFNSAKNVVVHPCNPSIQELEHEDCHEFKTSLGYM